MDAQRKYFLIILDVLFIPLIIYLMLWIRPILPCDGVFWRMLHTQSEIENYEAVKRAQTEIETIHAHLASKFNPSRGNKAE